MSGHLQQSPFIKSYDELSRSKKRMESFLAINYQLLSPDLRDNVQGMIENLQQAINYIPEEYQVERYKRRA